MSASYLAFYNLVCTVRRILSLKLIPSPGCRAFFPRSHLAQPVRPVLSMLPRAWIRRWLRFLPPFQASFRRILNHSQLQAIYHLLTMEFRHQLYHPRSRKSPHQSHRTRPQALYLLQPLQSLNILRLWMLQGPCYPHLTQRQAFRLLMHPLRPIHSSRRTYLSRIVRLQPNRSQASHLLIYRPTPNLRTNTPHLARTS